MRKEDVNANNVYETLVGDKLVAVTLNRPIEDGKMYECISLRTGRKIMRTPAKLRNTRDSEGVNTRLLKRLFKD